MIARLQQALRRSPRRHPRRSRTATPLSDDNLAALKEQLEAATGGHDVDLDTKVDPAIIGGLVVKLGSRMVDGSLRTKLNAIRTRMKEVG